MFDWVIADIAATTQAAVTAAPLNEQSRAGMANIVRTIAADTRVGRLLFSSQLSNPVVVRKRAESGALMAMLLFNMRAPWARRTTTRTKATSHFVVGGVGQTITAWLAGDITLDSDQLVDRLAAIIDQLADAEARQRTRAATGFATAAYRDRARIAGWRSTEGCAARR